MVHLPRSAVVVGGGAVGCATTLALARRGLRVVLVEAQDDLALAAGGENAGILRSGFDAVPGALETRLILRAAQLRDQVLGALGVPVLRCGAVMPRAPLEAAAVAGHNGVEVEVRQDGSLLVPGEAVTDPVHCTLALAAAAQAHGATVRTGFRVHRVGRSGLVTSAHDAVVGDVVIDCAGPVAEGAPEFFVFDAQLDCILLPPPRDSARGLLVAPTIDGKVIAGPADDGDWSAAVELHPALEGMEPIASYRGTSHVGGAPVTRPGLIDAAALGSSGLTAALGIAEHVAGIVAPGRAEAPLLAGERPPLDGPWWNRGSA